MHKNLKYISKISIYKMMFRDFRILSIVQKIEVPSDTLVYLWDVSPTYIFSGNLMHRNTGLPMCCQGPSSL